jgi:cytochrome d ubiquinol oxidase subunit II
MMLTAILSFLAAAVVLYVVLAGADFGAGILEIFGRGRPEVRRAVTHAMAPVWEANHVWLILIVVILFMGFPSVYTTISVHLFLPTMAVLVGVVGRGSAFTFRHYDVATPGHGWLAGDWSRAWSVLFAGSSLWTAAWLGVLAGAMVFGRIDPQAADAVTLYVAPWANPFCLAMAVFTCAVFALLAAVFLVGETREPALQGWFRTAAGRAAVVVVAAGAAVFGTAEAAGHPLLGDFFATPTSIAAFVLATLLLVPFARALRAGGRTSTRVLGVAIVTIVLFGWFTVQYPVAVALSGTDSLTFPGTAAPEATQRALLGALVVGIALLLPALAVLFRIFKRETFAR